MNGAREPVNLPSAHHGGDEIFRLLVERVQDYAIFVLDADGRVTTWNEGARRIKGYTAEEILGRHFSIFYASEDVEAGKPQDALRAAAVEGRFEDDGYRVRRDGSRFWANAVITALRNEEGQVVRFAKITRDLSEERARVEAEAAAARFRLLAEAGETLATELDSDALIESLARVGVYALGDWCAVDLVASDGGLVRQAVAHRGGDPIEIGALPAVSFPGPATGLSLDGLRAVPEQAAYHAALKDAGLQDAIVCPLRGSAQTLGVVTVASRTRTYAPLDVALAEQLVHRGGTALERVRLVDSLEDSKNRLLEQAAELEIQTEELQQAMETVEATNAELLLANDELARQTEEAMHARTAAESANRSKAEFLATMSHELRTPLNAIAGYAQLLELGVYGAISDKQVQAIQRVQRNQRHLLGLINDILNFVKLDAGQVRFDLADVRVSDTLADLELLVELQVRARQLLYSWEAPDPGLYVRVDRDRLDQVLLNLLSNAIKFTPAGGQVRVSCTSDELRVHIQIADTGVGIPADKLELIFEPFVQIGSGTRRAESEGVGLGLAISRDLVRSMGGDLTATSEVGRGSAFTLTLPRVRPPAPTAPVGEQPHGSSGEDRGSL